MTSAQASYAYFEQSLLELAIHRQSCSQGNDPSQCEVRFAVRDKNRALVELWWTHVPSPVAHEFLWDCLEVGVDGQEDLERFLNRLVETGVLTLSDGPTATPASRGTQYIPMYQYHPQRFRAVTPYAKQLAQIAQMGTMQIFSLEVMQLTGELLRRESNARVSNSPLRMRLKADQRAFDRQIQTALFYGDFVLHGRQIFDFPPQLTDGFRRSDVEDIPLEAIKLPYESFYLHFGPQKHLQTAPGWFPDGAYVSRIGDPSGAHSIQFCLTSVPESQATAEAWDVYPEPIYIQSVPSELMGTGIGEAVDRILSQKMAELTKQVAGSQQANIDLALQQVKDEFGAAPFASVEDVSSRNAKIEMDRIIPLHAVWREMLNLVVNAIAYLSSYREDVRTKWPDRAPVDMLKQMESGAPKQKQRARSKLAALGYTPVHLCGTKFVEMTQALGGTGDDEKQKKPTWVRGTWVWQAHGPKWTLRRLQWRMPYVRNKDSMGPEGDDPLGHLYLVS